MLTMYYLGICEAGPKGRRGRVQTLQRVGVGAMGGQNRRDKHHEIPLKFGTEVSS